MKQIALFFIICIGLGCQKEESNTKVDPQGHLGSLKVQLTVSENLYQNIYVPLPEIKVNLFYEEYDAVDGLNPNRIAISNKNGQVEFNNLDKENVYLGFTYNDSTYIIHERVQYNAIANADIRVLNDYTPLNTFFTPLQRTYYQFQYDADNDSITLSDDCLFTKDTLVVEVVERTGMSSWLVKEYFTNRDATDSLFLSNFSTIENLWVIENEQLIISNEYNDVVFSFLFFNSAEQEIRLNLSDNVELKESIFCNGFIDDYQPNVRNNIVQEIKFGNHNYENLLVQRGINQKVFAVDPFNYSSVYFNQKQNIVRSNRYLTQNLLETQKFIWGWEKI